LRLLVLLVVSDSSVLFHSRIPLDALSFRAQASRN